MSWRALYVLAHSLTKICRGQRRASTPRAVLVYGEDFVTAPGVRQSMEKTSGDCDRCSHENARRDVTRGPPHRGNSGAAEPFPDAFVTASRLSAGGGAEAVPGVAWAEVRAVQGQERRAVEAPQGDPSRATFGNVGHQARLPDGGGMFPVNVGVVAAVVGAHVGGAGRWKGVVTDCTIEVVREDRPRAQDRAARAESTQEDLGFGAIASGERGFGSQRWLSRRRSQLQSAVQPHRRRVCGPWTKPLGPDRRGRRSRARRRRRASRNAPSARAP